MEHLESVKKWYPKALTSIDTVNRLLDTIEKHIGLNRLVKNGNSACYGAAKGALGKLFLQGRSLKKRLLY
ncbi:hypothetical protein [Chryseobacterium sp. G0201]|uniref:hypothetical protein n=1 Tax=Chryseobacterium sp. G0201 TaxID=2487065 RepID=UPI000F4E189E|nr:hypothetical protein [Chryseobacterium sp. G0201]AZA53932.1 hypothetical protein EG348_13435 [Chryseobacterium sp. G0201]